MEFTFFPIKSAVGSCKKVSSTVISASSFCRKSPRLISQVFRNGPDGIDVLANGPFTGRLGGEQYRYSHKLRTHRSYFGLNERGPAQVYQMSIPATVNYPKTFPIEWKIGLSPYLVKKTIEINMDDTTCSLFKQDVFTVTVSKSAGISMLEREELSAYICVLTLKRIQPWT